MSTTADIENHKKGKLMTYFQVLDLLLEAYSAYDFIGEPEADIMKQKQPVNLSAVCRSKKFKESRCARGRV